MRGRLCARRLVLLLAICGLLSALPRPVRAAEGEVIKPETMEEFSDAVIDMIDQNKPVGSEGVDPDDTFYNKRLLVKVASGSMDFSKYHPVGVIQGGKLFVVQFAKAEDAEAAMEELQKLPASTIEYVEPDCNMEADATEAEGPHSWGVSVIGAGKLAAELAKKTPPEIKVAVVDSGVASHPFLSGRMTSGFDYIDNDSDPTDLYSHGTHVAGTIVDCTPGLRVTIMPVRVLDENGSGLALTTGLGVRYAADHGAKVINMSLSGRHTSFLDDSISYAIQKGATVVAAAGNKAGNTADYCPAHMSDPIVVGAVNSSLQVANFSNKGDSLDVVAPGVSISSTILKDKFGLKSGTSMAAPHVAALAAMYQMEDPARSPQTIQKMIQDNARDLGAPGRDNSYGYGLAEAYRTVSPTGISLNKKSLTLQVGKSADLEAVLSPAGAAENLTWKSSNKKIAAVKDGKVTAKKTGKATITVTTDNGKKATCKVTVKKKKPQPKPSKVKLNKTKLTLWVGESAVLKATVSPSNAVKKLTWSSSKKSAASVKDGKVTAKKAGKATITVKTSNGKKATCKVTVKKMTAKLALENYKNFLKKESGYQYFDACYINQNDIPDLMAVRSMGSTEYVYFIDGREAAIPTVEAAGAAETADDVGADGAESPNPYDLTYYYWEKRNLVMYDFRDPSSGLNTWKEYSIFAPCAENVGYKDCLLEFLSRVERPQKTMCVRYYTCDGQTDNAYYVDSLGCYVSYEDVTETEFGRLLASAAGGEEPREMEFVKNTLKNRANYLKK